MTLTDIPNMNYCMYCKHRRGMRCSRALINPSETEYAYCHSVRFAFGMDKPCHLYAPTLRERVVTLWRQLKNTVRKGSTCA